ncbi:GID complex subunit containing RING finger motif [Acarospora aff. strigata]|nr:GID complex subunit containing RING finger motif [Acarospora aff. strigata]
MAEITTTKLNAESHLLLDQPLLRLPHELARKNFKTVQKHIEHERESVLATLRSTANASLAGTPATPTLASLDSMIHRMSSLKRKLESLAGEEMLIQRQTRRRIRHLQDLYDIPSLADVKYDEWSRVRLNRLLVDYLLRSGYGESAGALAREKGIEELVDLEVFVQCHRVESSLRGGRTAEALAWCGEHRMMMKKISTMYSQSRWDYLASLFVKTHHELFSLPARPLLHIALSAGLSALKTPSCHSQYASSSSNASSSTTSVCPICSTELNDLARNVPYAHHTKSYVESDPIVLPNGRIYGRERLLQMSAKVGLQEGQVKDPTTQEVFDASKIRKVYIS